MYVIDDDIEAIPHVDQEAAAVSRQAQRDKEDDEEETPTEHSSSTVEKRTAEQQGSKSVSVREQADIVDYELETYFSSEIPNFGQLDDGSKEQEEATYCGCCGSKSKKRNFFNRWYNVVLAFVGWALVSLDLLTDIALIVLFMEKEQWVYGGVTLAIACVFYLFAAVMFRYNWMWSTEIWTPLLKCQVGFLMAVMGPFIMPPLLVGLQVKHYFQLRSQGLSERDRRAAERKLRTVVGAGVLYRLVQVFMQSAPQLLWQLYILLLNSESPGLLHSSEGRVLVLSVLSSLLNLVLVQAAFKDVDRIYRGNRKPQSRLAQFFNFLWRLAQTSGRVLSIALFATRFLPAAGALLLAHWFLMSVWYVKKLSPFDHSWKKRVLIGVASGFCSVFSHFVYAEVRPSRYWHWVLGALLMAENGLMLGLWFFFTPDQGTWVHMGGLIAALSCMALQVGLQLMYFKYCHPSHRRIPARTPCRYRVWQRMLCLPEWQPTMLTYDEIDIYH